MSDYTTLPISKASSLGAEELVLILEEGGASGKDPLPSSFYVTIEAEIARKSLFEMTMINLGETMLQLE